MKTLFTLLIPMAVFSQVGINTNNPQQGVHVANANAKVRIDALSAANNPLNLGTGNNSRVYVDANGDLILGTAQNNIAVLFDSENYLLDEANPSVNLITQHGYGDGYTYAGIPRDIPNSTFTLTEPAIIEINYSVSWRIEKNVTQKVYDGHANTAVFSKRQLLGSCCDA